MNVRDEQTGKNPVIRFTAYFGTLRLLLLSVIVITLIFAPEPGTAAIYSGWGFVPTVLAPVLAPLAFLVLILDAMMGGIMRSGKEGTERKRYRTIIVVNLLVALGFLLYWLPYYLALGK